jgi:hypothetical protein
MLEAAEVDRAPIIIGVLVALGVLVVLCLIVYAARLATIVHTMVHDGGRTRSPLTQLGLRASLRFVSSGRIGRMPGVVVISPPLLWFQMDTQTGPRFLPRFKKFPEHMRDLQFPRWWEEEIIFQSNNSAPRLSRRRLVFSLRHQDGGGHVGPLTDPAYINLKAGGGWFAGVGEGPSQFSIWQPLQPCDKSRGR